MNMSMNTNMNMNINMNIAARCTTPSNWRSLDRRSGVRVVLACTESQKTWHSPCTNLVLLPTCSVSSLLLGFRNASHEWVSETAVLHLPPTDCRCRVLSSGYPDRLPGCQLPQESLVSSLGLFWASPGCEGPVLFQIVKTVLSPLLTMNEFVTLVFYQNLPALVVLGVTIVVIVLLVYVFKW